MPRALPPPPCPPALPPQAASSIARWLRKHSVRTVFVACTGNNAEALELYEARRAPLSCTTAGAVH